MSTLEKKPEGWGYVNQSPKWHYFIDGMSICGRWMGLGLGELEKGNDNSSDNCAACKKKVLALKAKEVAKV